MLRTDSRGQSEVLALVFVFVIIISLIGLNQAFFVPQSNENTEFQHSQEIRGDMIDLRTGLIRAGSNNDVETTSVRLGVEYPDRFVGINPPPAGGTLRTVVPEGNDGNISVTGANMTDVCGTEEQPDTKFLEYEANYNQFRGSSPITIENSVLHRQGSSNTILDTGQVIVRGNRIEITRVIGEYRTTDVETEEVELIGPSETGITTIQGTEWDESVNITLPTGLEAEHWQELVDDNNRAESVSVEDSTVTIEMKAPNTTEEYIVRCSTVGVEEEPDIEPEQEPPLTGDPTAVINPFGPGTLELSNVNDDSGINATFVNRYDSEEEEDGKITVSKARIPYVNDPGFSAGDNITMTWEGNSTELEIGASEYTDIGREEMASGEYNNAIFVPDGSAPNTGFTLELVVEEPDGDSVTYTYFVSVEG